MLEFEYIERGLVIFHKLGQNIKTLNIDYFYLKLINFKILVNITADTNKW